MLSIRPPVECDLDRLCALARTIWQATYPALISQAQIDFMLAERYTAARIRDQLDDPGHVWRLALWADELAGFAHARIEGQVCKLDKLYIHSDYQRRGIGAALLHEIQTFARDRSSKRLWLQVNRANISAIAAYQKYGFIMREARVFDIGGGFVMDDYVMDASL